MNTKTMKISEFAKAGRVGVETIRYYQRKGLLPVPPSGNGCYREYNINLLNQLHFIRKAQFAGFSLKEIIELLKINVDSAKNRSNIQEITKIRLEKLEEKINILQDAHSYLKKLFTSCKKTSQEFPCPILNAFSSEPTKIRKDDLLINSGHSLK